MSSFKQQPRLIISHQPTPLEQAPRLSAKLGINLLFKRDDCTGLAGGGNKTRKLEYLLADAQQQGADTLVTIGGLQSTHARQTAAAAAKFGFNCELVLQDVPGTPRVDYLTNGNMFLHELLGATVHQVPVKEDCHQYANSLVARLQQQGKRPYLIPIGGSNAVGSLGYVRCALELIEQLDEQALKVDQLVVATGSAGTQAGLLAGLIIAGVDIPVLGITVSRPGSEQEQLVLTLLQQILQRLGLDPVLANGKVHANGDYYGASYGVVTQDSLNAISTTAQTEGILLDPVYTGKAMAGLIDLCQRGIIAKGSTQLFLHTGGSQALPAYISAFN